MCGVTGFFAYHQTAPELDPQEVSNVRDAMICRGPDGSGTWISSDRRVALAHRRLAIIDLSEKGSQPMKSEDGTVVISFNGEIYNYRELRSDLERVGRRFRTGTDTEVLLHLYAEKGEAMFGELRGMFALALWDSRRKVLLLVRDPYGIKPLYYGDDGRTVRSASQVKALLKSPHVSRAQDPAATAGFFLTGSVPEPRTLFQQVRSVPAGCCIQVDSHGPSQPRAYFSLAGIYENAPAEKAARSENELVARLREALLDSVRYHFVSDVPVGVFLSSGIDSGVLTGLAGDIGAKDLTTLTLAFEEFKGGPEDESVSASRVAAQYGARHRSYRVTQDEFNTDLPKILRAMDQPSVDGINTYLVSKVAAANGFKVALSGLGSDELFGGYPSFREVPAWVRQMRVLGSVPGLGRSIRSLLYPLVRSRQPKAAGMVEYGGSYEGAYFLKRGLFMPWELEFLMRKDAAEEGLRELGWLSRLREALPQRRTGSFLAVSSLESQFYMRNQLLRDADWAGMAHSVEIRVPFVDGSLVRRLAPMLRSNPGVDWKRILARVPSVPLPADVVHRKKTGFSVPIEPWTASDGRFGQWQRIPILRGRGVHWSRRWAFTVFSSFLEAA